MSAKKEPATLRDYDVIRRPVITEKATIANESGKVTFAVAMDATKPEIKQAVTRMFGVDVVSINTVKLPGKTKRFRGIKGKQNDLKKAIITLKDGQSIDAFGGVK